MWLMYMSLMSWVATSQWSRQTGSTYRSSISSWASNPTDV
jgi:hypothetical protein